MIDFFTDNAHTILLILKIGIIFYAILATIGVVRRVIKYIEKHGWKEGIGFIIYNSIGHIIFLIFVIVLFYFSDILLNYSGL